MIRRPLTVRMSLVAVLIAASSVAADTIHVPGDYPTIQQGIDAAVNGDVVLVAAGTYLERIDFNGKAITVRSEDGPAATVIEEPNWGTLVTFDSGEGNDSVLEGFKLTLGGATNGRGGALYIANSSPQIIDCHIHDNLALDCDGYGGGAYLINSSAIFLDCLFTENNAGGITCGGSTGAVGGAIYSYNSSPVISNCRFEGNGASVGGGMGISAYSAAGAIYCYGGSPVITGCEFRNNRAGTGDFGRTRAGAIYVFDSSPTIERCLFDSNTAVGGDFADVQGGGIYNSGAGLLIEDCLFESNAALGHGSSTMRGGAIISSGSPQITRCGFGGNAADQGGGVYVAGGVPTISDSFFCSNVADHVFGQFINVGTVFRDECQLFVPADFATIQLAIDVMPSDGVIEVGPGTYPETIAFRGRAVTVASSEGEGPDSTIIDAEGAGTVVTFFNGEGPDTILEGFTLTGGAAADGAGLFIEGASPTIRDCRVIDNEATTNGGGAWVDLGAPVFERCDFVRNRGDIGGGLNLIDSSAELLACRLLGNVATSRGAAISQSFSDPLLVNCLLVGNSAGEGAGAISNYLGYPELINSTLSANNAASVGGIRNQGSDSGVTLTNVVMWGNYDNGGSGESAQIGLIQNAPPGNVLVDYSCVQGWTGQYGGTGNIGSDPLFLAAPDPGPDLVWGTEDDDYGDLHLPSGSPGVDAADNTAVPPGTTTDLDGSPRFADDPDTPDTGNGDPPIVDMGAYELLAAETICPDDAGDYLKSFGGPVTGDALDLCASDDIRLEVRQSAPITPLLPFVRLEYWAHTALAGDTVSRLDFVIEGHVSANVSGGQNPDTLRTLVKNFSSGSFELQDQRGTPSNADVVIEFTIDANASDYVNAADGEIRIRQDVFNPGNVAFPLWSLKVDQYEVTVTP